MKTATELRIKENNAKELASLKRFLEQDFVVKTNTGYGIKPDVFVDGLPKETKKTLFFRLFRELYI